MMNSLGSLNIHKMTRGSNVTAAIQQASAKTGVDFGYLVKQAEIESSLNPNAKAKTSSATGLYQFIEQTWLRMVKNHGAEHGMEKFADAISQKANGEYVVANRALKSSILNLRRDPKAASLMAAELATENHNTLKQSVSRDITSTDLYLAHFMGADGASNFLNSMKKNPWAPAASLFPDAARANRGVFYENGKPLSLQAVYNKFDSKFDGVDEAPVTETAENENTFMRKVILPLANDWSNPDLDAASVISASLSSRGTTGLMAFAPENTGTEAVSGRGRIGGFMSNPADVMMLAHETASRFMHEDSNRYNS